MPLYEYRCRHCEEGFEILQRLGEGAEGLVCPKCGGADLRKQFSTFAAASTSSQGASVGGTAPGCGSGFT